MATKYRVEITKTKQIDIEEIWTHVATDSVDAATRFVIQLEEKAATLGKLPARCPSIPENLLLGSDYRPLSIGDYRVIFRIAQRSVWVLRILHGGRLLDRSFFG